MTDRKDSRPKIVSLTVHRNTRQRRKEREASDWLVKRARQFAKHKAVDGYVLVAWNRWGVPAVSYWRGDAVPRHALSAYVQSALATDLAVDDARDSLFPPPPDKGA